MADQEEEVLFEAPEAMLRISNRFIYCGAALYSLASVNSLSIGRDKRGLSRGCGRTFLLLFASLIMDNILLVLASSILVTAPSLEPGTRDWSAFGQQTSDSCSNSCAILFWLPILYAGTYVVFDKLLASWEGKGPYQVLLGTNAGTIALVTSKDMEFVRRIQEAVRQAFKSHYGKDPLVTVSGGMTVIQNPQNSQILTVWAEGSSAVGNISQQG